MRYDEEYKSRFMLSPHAVIVMIVAVIILVIILKLFFPIPISATNAGQTPLPVNGFILPFLGF